MFDIGLSVTTLNPFGGVESMVRLLTGPKTAYKSVPRYAKLFDNILQFSVTLTGKNKARIEMGLDGDYPWSQGTCYLAQGILSAIPTLWGLPPAEIHEEKCMCQPGMEHARDGVQYGAEACVYEINWQPLASWSDRLRDNVFHRGYRVSTNVGKLERNLWLLDQKNTELVERNKQLAVVREIAINVDKVRTINEALSLAVEQAREIEGVRFAIILKIDEPGQYVFAPYHSKIKNRYLANALKAVGFDPYEEFGESSDDKKLRIPLSKLNSVQDYLTNPRVTFWPRISKLADGAWPKVLCDAIQKILGVKQLVLLPLLVDGSLWGSMLFFLTREVPVDILEMIDAHCATAIKNVTALVNLEKRNKELSSLNAVINTTSATLNVTEMLQNAIREVTIALDSDAGAIFLPGNDGKELYLAAQTGMPDNTEKNIKTTRAIDSPFYNFILSDEHLICGDMLDFASEFPGHALTSGKPSSVPFATAQLRINSESRGLMAVVRKDRPPFDSSETSMLRSIAKQLAIAIEKALLHEDVIAKTEETEKATLLSRESDAKSRLIIESVAEGVIVTDLNGVIKGGNRQFVAMHGFNAEAEMLGLSIFQFLAKKDRTRAMQDLHETLDTGSSGLLEYTSLRKDGSEFPVELSISLIRDVSGQPTGCVATSRDITGRQRAELALRESEEKYRSIFESANDVIIVLDRKAKILDVNGRIVDVGGYEKSDLVGHDFRKLASIMTKKSLAILAINYAKRLAGINVPPYEVDLYKKNREIVNLEVNAVPLKINDKIVGDLAIFRDITQQKRSIQAVRESEEKFSKAFQVSPNACSITSLEDGKYIEINDSFTQITGYNRREVIGSTARKLNLWADEREGEKIRPILRKRGRVTGEEITFRTKTGEIRRGIYSAEIVKLSGDDCVLVTINDITDRKRMEDELRKAIIKADAANQAKSDFLARMSHEIRTPIHGVMGTLELLRDTELGQEQRQYVNMARTSADTLLNVINDILDFSKIEAGKIKLESTNFKVRKVAEEALSTVAVLAQKKGLEVLLQVSHDVPATVTGDAVRLQQVLVNLLGNAIKFTEKGEIVLRAGTENVSDKEAELHFSIRDTGIGIPEEKQEVLFHPFEQVDGSNSRKYGGSGLGLSICKQLVSMMNGRIWFTSRPGEGSIFHFTAKFGNQAVGERAESLPQIASAVRGLPLLVIDDNATCRSILRDTLTKYGFQVTEADSIHSGLEELKNASGTPRQFRVVLLDKTLPATDVFAAGRTIMRDPALRPGLVMMLPSDNISSDFARCQESGISHYMVKPIKEADLVNVILSALGRANIEKKESKPVTPVRLGVDIPRLRILVAEDNITSQLIVKTKLEKVGHSVRIANNGLEAIRMVKEEVFDLILMDFEMPEMNGLEATRVIRKAEQESGRHIPIIAMTAYAMKEDKEKCLEAGMDAYLSKPVKLDELHSVINDISLNTNVKSDVMDVATALELVEGDEHILKEVVGIFLEEDYPEQLKRLKDGLNQLDAQAVRIAAHGIKGAVRSFGCATLAGTALQLEEMGRKNDFTGSNEALQKLEEGAKQLTDFFARYSRQIA
ncbi:MAG: PAS domain S-box protein [Dehalococcoidales bacterium]